MTTDTSQFYTGLVAELYAPLRGSTPDIDACERFVRSAGGPALELGCGQGEPLLDLIERGLDVEGLDSSADMLDLTRNDAAERGLTVALHHQNMAGFDLGRQFQSIFLAGPTFNLLATDDEARSALAAIYEHLVPGGQALIPLFVPRPVPEKALGPMREMTRPDGALISCSLVAVDRDEAERRQTAVLRYELTLGDEVEQLDRPWILHWFEIVAFAEMATKAGFDIVAITDAAGEPANDESDPFAGHAFLLRRASAVL